MKSCPMQTPIAAPGNHPTAMPHMPSGAQISAGASASFDQAVQEALPPVEPVRRDMPKVGRNDDCPCGSGKKHKKCCGKGAA